MQNRIDIHYKVYIKCSTFNHASYIEDAMNGFCMQKTTFPFLTIICDDASTDGEPEVIRDYLQKNFMLSSVSGYQLWETDEAIFIFAQHKQNVNCFFLVIFLNKNHYSQRKPKNHLWEGWTNPIKYIARCEGDDYWTDPLKLQKQVDFLEANPDYSICSHDFVRYNQNTLKFQDKSSYHYLFVSIEKDKDYYDYSLDCYFDGWWTHTLTCMYRNGTYLDKIPREKYLNIRDDILYYYILKEGKGAILRDIMGTYRIHNSGVWSNNNYIEKKESSMNNAYNIFLVEKDQRAFRKILRIQYEVLLFLKKSRKRSDLIKCLFKYFKMDPLSVFLKLVWSITKYDCWILYSNILFRIKKGIFFNY